MHPDAESTTWIVVCNMVLILLLSNVPVPCIPTTWNVVCNVFLILSLLKVVAVPRVLQHLRQWSITVVGDTSEWPEIWLCPWSAKLRISATGRC